MKKTLTPPKTERMRDEAVRAMIGKGWDEWFALLDVAGAAEMKHPAIAAMLPDKYGCPPWWSQMVTVTYERERGLRVKHQVVGGFSMSKSNTLDVPAAILYEAWHDAKKRARWLQEKGLTIREATQNKAMYIAWPDGNTNVEVQFCRKWDGKCQVTVQHSKLANIKVVEQMKVYWGEVLERLGKMLDMDGN